jgi:hypothetical protein
MDGSWLRVRRASTLDGDARNLNFAPPALLTDSVYPFAKNAKM